MSIENMPNWVNLVSLPIIVILFYFIEHGVAVFMEPKHIPKSFATESSGLWKTVKEIEGQLAIVTFFGFLFGAVFGVLDVDIWRIILVECLIGIGLISTVDKQLRIPAAFLYETGFVIGELVVHESAVIASLGLAAVLVIGLVAAKVLPFFFGKGGDKR